MKKKIVYIFTLVCACLFIVEAKAQERTVENRPYTDLRPFHFGVLVGSHFQDMEFVNGLMVKNIEVIGIMENKMEKVNYIIM